MSRHENWRREAQTKAQEIAEQRAPEQLAALRANASPHDPEATPFHTQNRLADVGVFVPLAELAQRDNRDRRAAILWAVTCDSREPMPRPEWLPGRDLLNIGRKVNDDRWSYGTPPAARNIYDDQWHDTTPPEDPGEYITDEQAALLDALEHIEEVRNIIRRTLGLPTEEQELHGPDDTSVVVELIEPEKQDDSTSSRTDTLLGDLGDADARRSTD